MTSLQANLLQNRWRRTNESTARSTRCDFTATPRQWHLANERSLSSSTLGLWVTLDVSGSCDYLLRHKRFFLSLAPTEIGSETRPFLQ